MRKFLKHILKKSQKTEGPVVLPRPVIGNPIVTLNNGCHTIYEGSYTVPKGTIGTIVGELISGNLGSGTTNIIGTINNISPGKYQYIIDLGNSGQSGVKTAYKLTLSLDNGLSRAFTFFRDANSSPFFDDGPC